MNIEELFDFLTKDYNLSYRYQSFNNAYGGNWIIETYSFYNDSGCFTIYYLPQRQELEFYYAPQFSTKYKELCERRVDICSIEPKIWDRHTKTWVFNRPFFWWKNKKVLNVLAEALRVHLVKEEDFFGIHVNKNIVE